MKSKITILGAGNAGCISALTLLESKYEHKNSNIGEIEIIHDPSAPIEKVGQGNTVNVHELIFKMLDLNWFDRNTIQATPKTGIRYKNWGSKNHNFFHPFQEGSIACHYIPHLFCKEVLNLDYFKVKEDKILELNDIDSDFIIDCRGKSLNSCEDYNTINNPLNSALLYQDFNSSSIINYTDCVATPHGWTFIIPNINSTSYGYLFNERVTQYSEAEKDFASRFSVEGHFTKLKFKNYLAKNIWHDSRTILNGNRYCFIEPLEATSTTIYKQISENLILYINNLCNKEDVNDRSEQLVKECAYFINRHYKFGSKFDTPFWNYASNISTPDSPKYENIIREISHWDSLDLANYYFWESENNKALNYGTWEPPSIINWEQNSHDMLDKLNYL